MKNKLNTLFERRNNMPFTIGLTLLGLMGLLSFQYYGNNMTFGQTADVLAPSSQFNSSNNNSGIANPNTSVPNLNQSLTEQQPPSGFAANGKVNTVVTVPVGKWLATGDWHITLNNGNVTSFDTNMTWYNSTGTNAHTHQLTNLRPAANDQQLSLKKANNDIIIKGVTDVGSNNKIAWFDVPTTITLNDRRILSISLDDNKTNHHFGGQPILGIVDSYEPCSDLPGANMEVLPSCSDLSLGEQNIGLTNETLAFPPSEGSIPYQGGFPGGEQFQPSQNQTGGLGGEQFQPSQGGFPGGEQFQPSQGGFPGGEQFQPSEDQTGGQGTEQFQPYQGGFPGGGQFPPSEDQTGGQSGGQFPPSEDQTGVGKAGGQPQINPECTDLSTENITANGFETDPSDYHPPSDAIDGDSSTWWSNNEKNSWVELNLGQPNTICGLTIEWNKGDTRDYSFKVAVSNDGNDYKDVFKGTNKKGSSNDEDYPFEKETNGQYVKVTIPSTSSGNGWVSIKEIKAIGIPPH
jgi:hypothetical protein